MNIFKWGSFKGDDTSRVRLPCADATELFEKYGQDLADGGIFIRQDRSPAVGSLVQVDFAIGEKGDSVSRVLGKVEHARSAIESSELSAGMRVRFVQLDEVATRVAQEWAKSENTAPHRPDPLLQTFSFRALASTSASKTDGPIIGIDLGTVNTCVAAVIKGVPKVIASPEGYETIPSVVFIASDGAVTVGKKALEKLFLEPKRGVSGAKRFLGRPFTSKEVRSLGHFFNYGLVEGTNGRTAAEVAGQVIALEEISALVLSTARTVATKALGCDVSRAVVTVPAYFGETQRQAVLEAGSLAGLVVERIINEPTAAAVSYGFGRGLERTILVYDLGGGTFDASILTLSGDNLEVLATDGDPFLGGQDFDDRLTEYILMNFERANKMNLRIDPIALQRVRFEVQKAKHELSETEVAMLEIPYIAGTETRQLDLHMKIKRKLLEDLTQDLVDRTLKIVDSVLNAADLRSSEIEDVLLVGGQSRAPAVRRALTERFGRKPSSAVHPDHAVAIGAAIVADALKNSTPLHLIDVLPSSIRMMLAGNQTSCLLQRGMRLPAERQFALNVPETVKELRVTFCRGEEKMFAQNVLLGTVRVASKIIRLPGSLKAHFAIRVSEQGILSVVVRDVIAEKNIPLELSLSEN